jgi:hypothetical protein
LVLQRLVTLKQVVITYFVEVLHLQQVIVAPAAVLLRLLLILLLGQLRVHRLSGLGVHHVEGLGLGLERRQLIARALEVRAIDTDAAKVLKWVLVLGTVHAPTLDHWVLIELDYVAGLLGRAATRNDVALGRAVEVLVALDSRGGVHVIVDETLALEEVLAALFLLLALHALAQLLHQPQDLQRQTRHVGTWARLICLGLK